MAIQSIVSATFVSAIIAAISNVIAQRISALKDGVRSVTLPSPTGPLKLTRLLE